MIGDQERAAEAARLIIERDRRYGLFPSEIFDEFPWNMLLHLFVALVANQTMSEARLCELAHVGTAAGRRWVRHLAKNGQVEAREDGSDVVLTEDAVGRLREYLQPRSDAIADLTG